MCTESKLRRIEEQEQEGEKLLIDALVQRLGKSMNKYDLLLEHDEYALLIHRVRIQQKLRQSGRNEESLYEAEQEILAYEQTRKTKTRLHRQFICLQKAELLRRRNADWREQWDTVCEGLCQTIERSFWKATPQSPTCTLDMQRLNGCYFSMLEMLLLERYATLLEAVEKIQAVNWYHFLADYISQDRQDGAECRMHYPFMAYHLARYYLDAGSPDYALKFLDKALEMFAISKRQIALFARCFEMKLEILRKHREYEQNTFHLEQGECCLAIFCEIVTEQKEVWQENYYPFYIEVHAHCVSKIIHERRELLGLTQEQLAEGICDAGTLSRIERGAHSPQSWTKERLLKKLNVTPLKYDGGIVTEDYADYRRAGEMENTYYEGECAKAKEIFAELQKKCQMSISQTNNLQNAGRSG